MATEEGANLSFMGVFIGPLFAVGWLIYLVVSKEMGSAAAAERKKAREDKVKGKERAEIRKWRESASSLAVAKSR